MNHLFYGDNLRVLRDSIASESVDLVYLDPPFNPNASYNVLFKGPSGNDSAAQIEAFDDTWHWATSGLNRRFKRYSVRAAPRGGDATRCAPSSAQTT